MRSALCAILITLALPAVALASGKPIVPQGNASANQYIESVPTARGQRPTSTVARTGAATTSSGSVPSATARTLAHAGASGRQAAAFAAETGPAAARHRARHAGSRTRSDRHATAASGGRSGGSGRPGGAAAGTAWARRTRTSEAAGSRGTAVADAVTGLSGTNATLTIIMVVLALGAVAVRLRLRRPAE